MTSLDIVIVNWNTGSLLAKCLQSIATLPLVDRAPLGTVYVVDNASTDSSLSQAQEVVSEKNGIHVRFIPSKENLGFAGGNNVALKKIPLGTESPHVLLLNPDTTVHPGALPALLRVLLEQPRVGIVGPKLVNPDGSLQPSVRPLPQFHDFVAYLLKLGRVMQSRQENAHDYSQAGVVDQVMGAAFLIRNSVREQIGDLDDDFFTLFEEVDYCKRAKDAGWDTYFTPAGVVMHVKAVSFNQLVGWQRTRPWIMSALHYADKHLPSWQVLVLRLLLPATIILTIPATFKHVILKKRNDRRVT